MESALFCVFIYRSVINMQKNTELTQLEILEIRKIILNERQKRRSWSLKLGFIGESEVELWLLKYGHKDWHIVQDYWFYYKNEMQADFLVVMEKQWLVLEVKNFDGKFEYKNHECIINNRLMDGDFMSNMSTKVRRIKRIAAEVSSEIEVIGAMIFINEHCEVELSHSVYFEIVLRNQLRKFLKNYHEFSTHPLQASYFNQVEHVLNRYATTNPFQPTGLPVEGFAALRKGVTCVSCHSFDVDISMKKVSCKQCGVSELKSKAILRSAQQLRYVYFDNPEMVTTGNVYEFMGGKGVSKTSIRKVLGSAYEKVGKTNKVYYKIDV